MIKVLLFLLAGCRATVNGQHGALHTWGVNNLGQLGDGSGMDRYSPTAISVSGKSFATLVMGGDHAGAITTDGALYMWGYNFDGQVGDYSQRTQYSPVLITVFGKTFAVLALGASHSGAITTDGALYMWGSNFLGQIGIRTYSSQLYPIAVTVLGKLFATLSLGGAHSGAITTDGALYMWGSNGNGQVGDGTNTLRTSPTAVTIAGKSFAVLALGFYHSGAITTDGTLYMWGCNSDGQLGDGTLVDHISPFAISVSGKKFATLALGGSQTGAITTDGTLYMWGINNYGQLGTGFPTSASLPTAVVIPGKSFVTVSCGGAHAGATTTEGSLYMWGRNTWGQLGDGTSDHHTPTPITLPGNRIAAFSVGARQTGAVSIVPSSPSPSPKASSSPRPSPSPVSSSPSPNSSGSPSPSPDASTSPGPSLSPASPSRSPSRSIPASRSPSRSVPATRSPSRSAPPSRSPSRSASPQRSPSRSALPSPSPSLSPGEQCDVQQCSATAVYWLTNCGGCIHLGDTVPSPCQTGGGMAGASVDTSSSARRNSQATVDVAVDGAITPSSSTGSNVYNVFGASVFILIGFVLNSGLSILLRWMRPSSAQPDHSACTAP